MASLISDEDKGLVPKLDFKTLDLRDPTVEKEFLKALKSHGVPCG